MNFKILDRAGRWIFYYLISSAFFAGGTHVISKYYRNNMWFFSPMAFVQFLILTIFFYHVIKNQLFKRLCFPIAVFVTVFAALDFFYWEGIYNYNSYALTVENSVLLFYSGLFFWELLRDEELVKNSIFVNNLPAFWYNCALFIFHCSNFMLSLSYNFLQHEHLDKGIQNATLCITFIGGFAEVVLIWIGLLKAKKMSK